MLFFCACGRARIRNEKFSECTAPSDFPSTHSYTATIYRSLERETRVPFTLALQMSTTTTFAVRKVSKAAVTDGPTHVRRQRDRAHIQAQVVHALKASRLPSLSQRAVGTKHPLATVSSLRLCAYRCHAALLGNATAAALSRSSLPRRATTNRVIGQLAPGH